MKPAVLVIDVIHDFVYEVVQRTDICASHVHTRPASDGLQSFQYLDLCRAISGKAICLGQQLSPVIFAILTRD